MQMCFCLQRRSIKVNEKRYDAISNVEHFKEEGRLFSSKGNQPMMAVSPEEENKKVEVAEGLVCDRRKRK